MHNDLTRRLLRVYPPRLSLFTLSSLPALLVHDCPCGCGLVDEPVHIGHADVCAGIPCPQAPRWCVAKKATVDPMREMTCEFPYTTAVGGTRRLPVNPAGCSHLRSLGSRSGRARARGHSTAHARDFIATLDCLGLQTPYQPLLPLPLRMGVASWTCCGAWGGLTSFAAWLRRGLSAKRSAKNLSKLPCIL